MFIHELKILPRHFAAQEAGLKNYELRRDDRAVRFDVGQHLHLREWSEETGYTGALIIREVTHVLRGVAGLAPGYVVLSTVDPYPPHPPEHMRGLGLREEARETRELASEMNDRRCSEKLMRDAEDLDNEADRLEGR